MDSTKTFLCCSWNVRGLGDKKKCDQVLAELFDLKPHILALQETKLSSIPHEKLRSFLPSRLDSTLYNNSIGTSGGTLTAWDSTFCSQVGYVTRRYSVSVTFSLAADNSKFCVTNVYAPTHPQEKLDFLEELKAIALVDDMPWAIMGDFNLTRFPGDKSSTSFNQNEADLFKPTLGQITRTYQR